MHRLLERHLSKLGLAPDRPPATKDAWTALMEQLDKTFEEMEQDRHLLERSMTLASEETREVYERMRESTEERYRNLFEHANDIIYTIDIEGRFTTLNRAAEQLVGYDRSELIGRHYRAIVAPEHVDLVAEMTRKKVTGSGPVHRYEIDIIDRDGVRRTVELNTRLIMREGKPYEVLGLARDVSERKEEERQLRHVAEHDSLTGLPNRLVLQRALREAIIGAEKGRNAALAFVDLDNFKIVNDTLGHAAGDSLLANVATMLRGRTRPGDLLVRLGGDEFAILLRDIAPDDALAICDRLRTAIMEEPFYVGDRPFTLGVSIGLSAISLGDSAETALALADSAMYTAKSRGGGQVVWAESAPSGARPSAPVPTTTIVTATYDPVFSLRTGQVSSFIARPGEPNPGESDVRTRLLQRDQVLIDAACEALAGHPGISILVALSRGGQGDLHLADYTLARLGQRPDIAQRIGFLFSHDSMGLPSMVTRSWLDPLRAAGAHVGFSGLSDGLRSLIDGSAAPGDTILVDLVALGAIAQSERPRKLVNVLLEISAEAGVNVIAGPVRADRGDELVRELGIPLAYGPRLSRTLSEPRWEGNLAA